MIGALIPDVFGSLDLGIPDVVTVSLLRLILLHFGAIGLALICFEDQSRRNCVY
jgi:hypothetical protein